MSVFFTLLLLLQNGSRNVIKITIGIKQTDLEGSQFNHLIFYISYFSNKLTTLLSIY